MKEYKIVGPPNRKGVFRSELDIVSFEQLLNEHAKEGWRVVSSSIAEHMGAMYAYYVILERDVR